MVEREMKRRTSDATVGGLDLVEQAMHALRLAPASTLLCYYAGSVPFVLALLFYWSDMSRSGLAERHLVPGAIGLSLLFAWMKLWQSVFTTRLAAQISHEPPPRFTAAELFRAAGSQTLLQASGLVLLPIAANVLLPLGWMFAFYQNASVLGLRETSLGPLIRRSWRQARYAPGQNHVALSLLTLFGFVIFLNVTISLLALPHLLKMLFGVESSFTLSPMSSLNTTFLAAAAGVAYLCLDPIIKAAFTWRCFHGEARTTGEDLRVSLRGFSAPAAALLLTLLVLCPGRTIAADPRPEVRIPPSTQTGEALDHSIDEVLKRAEYTWRSPREKQTGEPKEENAMWRRVRKWLGETWQALTGWLEKLFRGRTRTGTPGKFSFSSEGLIYLLIAAVVIIIGVLAYFLWRTRSRSTSAEMEATPAAPLPDLEKDDVAGDELPVDGWAKLALELLERGELRLAMRAFYLSSLAHLAGRNLVSIARFKSNRDYERELLRRSHALPELAQFFSDNVRVFDRVWYGRHEIDDELLRHFRSNVERIRAC